jgi:hypothetical protein
VADLPLGLIVTSDAGAILSSRGSISDTARIGALGAAFHRTPPGGSQADWPPIHRKCVEGQELWGERALRSAEMGPMGRMGRALGRCASGATYGWWRALT